MDDAAHHLIDEKSEATTDNEHPHNSEIEKRSWDYHSLQNERCVASVHLERCVSGPDSTAEGENAASCFFLRNCASVICFGRQHRANTRRMCGTNAIKGQQLRNKTGKAISCRWNEPRPQ